MLLFRPWVDPRDSPPNCFPLCSLCLCGHEKTRISHTNIHKNLIAPRLGLGYSLQGDHSDISRTFAYRVAVRNRVANFGETLMWKSRKEEEKPVVTPSLPTSPTTAPFMPSKEVRPMETTKPADSYRADVAHIGKSVLVKGELSGSEDLYLDGEVEGSIELRDHSLIVGPHGRVRANVHARDVVVHGKVDGNIRGTERVELKKSAVLVGDISTQRIIIEDGAYFKGAIDIQKETPKPESRRETALAAAGTPASSFTTAPSTPATASNPGSAGSFSQSPLLEKKY